MHTRDRLIQENTGLVHACARRFARRGAEYEDLFQVGCVGLIKAADNFDETRGVRFSTYAVPAIMGEIKRIFRDEGAIKVSRSLRELGIKISFETEAFQKREGRSPTVSELAEILGIDAGDIAEAVGAIAPPVSLTMLNDENEAVEAAIEVEAHDEHVADILSLRQVFSELPGKDKRLIVLRFFRGYTQTRTAEELGMTQVQVSRREKAIISELRTKLAG